MYWKIAGAFLCGVLCAPAQQNTPEARAWWESGPLRIVDVVTSYDELNRYSPAEWAERKAALGYNTEHLELMNFTKGLDDRGWYFRSKLASKVNPDFLRAYLPEAKKRGIRVMIYFNVHWYTRDFGAQHPDWLQIREDGQPPNVYVTGTDFCVNSPWREWVFQVLRDLAAYPIDGIFFDGPIFFADTCYCPYCAAKYKKLHGTPLPSKKVRTGSGARDLLQFQAESLAEFLRDSRKILKAANPGIGFYMNGGERGGNWATARLNRVLIGEQDLLGSEGGFIGGNDLLRMPVWKPGVTARLLETQSAGKPRVIFSATQHKPWTFSILPKAELRLLYAGTIANAASVWFGMWPTEFDLPEMQALADMNRFTAKNAGYYRDTRSEAKVALVWSDTTANYYEGSDAQSIELDRVPSRRDVGNLNGEFSGFAEALIRSHVPFDVVDDVTLERESLDRYRAIVLPNVACMSARTAERLQNYVSGGGGVLATFETSLYDETGIRRQDFALAPLFGASAGGRIVGPMRWDFMKASGSDRLLDGLERALIPSPVYHLQVKSGQSQTLLRFTKPLAGVYDGIPAVSDDPALLVRGYGKGRVIYFPGDLGNAMNTFRLPEFLRLIGNSVRSLAPPPVILKNAPASVEVVLRSQPGGRRLLHLVNFTGEMTRPIERVLPLRDVSVTLADAKNVKRVHTLAGGRDLPYRTFGSGITFTIPVVEDYEVIIIE